MHSKNYSTTQTHTDTHQSTSKTRLPS